MLPHFVSDLLKNLALPLYWFVLASFISFFLWSIFVATQDGINRLKRLHQVPCGQCAFFTGDYRLKCTVHPITALSEEAINCRDFELSSALTSSRSCCPQIPPSKHALKHLKKYNKKLLGL